MRAWITFGALGALAAAAGCGASRAPFGIDERPANGCVAQARPVQSNGELRLERVFPGLTFAAPTAMAQAPGDPSRWYVTEQRGTVRSFPNDQAATQAMVSQYVDLSGRLTSGGEAGLLGIAFHPRFQSNKQVYLSYTAKGPWGGRGGGVNLRSTVSRFLDKGGTLDPADEQKVFPPDDSGDAQNPGPTDQPYSNHNGGNIVFGPDGMLYYGLGDGGSGGDPENSGQRVDTFLGKIHRVDVDNIPAGKRYGIPAGNPFAGGGGRPEIFAWGLRNPWRFTFDRDSGELWVGDVGQNAWEEIDKLVVGGNYGWHTREGKHCYSPMNGCSTAGLIDPVVDYSHNGGGASVVGGYVYRGKAMPGLTGVYFYGDTVTQELFAISYDTQGVAHHTKVLDAGVAIYSFAEDADGELYLTTGGGSLYQLVPMGTPVLDPFPKTLSATGCVDPNDATQPAPGLIPYDVAAPLWADGAQKRRWVAIPDGKTITVGADGDFDLPVGSVAVKEFSLGGRRVETRLFMRHQDGEWAGYSYEWNDDGRDATLLPAGKQKAIGDQLWTFPSRSDCLTCHTTAAGGTLGLESAQLNHELTYEQQQRISNQLATFDHLGLFDKPLGDPALLPSLPGYDDPAPLETRARAYLHANCSICHRPNGTGQGMQDLRASVDFKSTLLCNVDPQESDLGVAGVKLITPGAPARSIVSLRVHALDATRMPPLATVVVDPVGSKLIDDWIASLTACP